MSDFSDRRRVMAAALFAAVALSSALAAAEEGPRTGIFMKIEGIAGSRGVCGAFQAAGPQWTPVMTLQLGSQTISSSSPWFITPPPGVSEMTLTKRTDAASPGISSAFAGERQIQVVIDICQVGPDGAIKKVGRYTLTGAKVSGFTSAPPTETVVLAFTTLGVGFPPELVTSTRARRLSAPAATRRLQPVATPTPPR